MKKIVKLISEQSNELTAMHFGRQTLLVRAGIYHLYCILSPFFFFFDSTLLLLYPNPYPLHGEIEWLPQGRAVHPPLPCSR